MCVDRDDDLGVKAAIHGPVIGREENLRAMIALGLADPEEVDTNAILSGLQLYDDLLRRGMDTEIATISGDTRVGFQSDLILSNQLENVLEVVKPDRAILVSDGAEDESIYPVISSRIKIDSVRRVYVKQNKSIEGTYYMIAKTLRDEKMRRRWIIPTATLLILWSLFTILTIANIIKIPSALALGVLGIVLGLYLIGWAYEWASMLRNRLSRTRKAIHQGSLTIPFAIVAFVLVVVGMLVGYDMTTVYNEGLLPNERSLAIAILLFASGATWFVVFGVFAYESGKSVTAFLQTGKIRWSFIVIMISVLATGFIVQGAVDALELFVYKSQTDVVVIFAEIITGILMAVFGSVLSTSLRREAARAGGSTSEA